VFVTKYRKNVITESILARLKEIFAKLCETQKCGLVEFNGEADYVHLLVDLAPDIAISKLVNILKTISSREIRKEFKEHIGFTGSLFFGLVLIALSPQVAHLSKY